MVSYTKGKRFRLVGRHTQDFLSRAAKRSAANELQKKVFFIAAVCADEITAAMLKLEIKPEMRAFKNRQVRQRVPAAAITTAMRVYISALLVAISSQKASLLDKMHMEEAAFLEIWCWAYGYQPADMVTFNEMLLPSYQQKGIESLAACAGGQIAQILFEGSDALSKAEIKTITKTLTNDAAAILSVNMQ